MTRYVDWWDYEKSEQGVSVFEKVLKGRAIFHEFGVDYEEFDSGPGNFSTAVIELPDGTVKNVPVENIAFK